MIERHHAGVIENWDGQRIPAEAQIRAARAAGGRGMGVLATPGTASDARKSLQIGKSRRPDSNRGPLHYE